MVNNKLVDIVRLTRYHENLKGVLSTKQGNIEDLETIREGAALGATALQAVPEEYVTETELTAKDYATVSQVNEKQDIIEDLQTIREGAAAGATALQAVPEEYVTETELTAKDYATVTQVNAKQDIIEDLQTIREGAAAGAVAEENAKSYAKDYADGLAGNYDAAGSAAQALSDAKDFATNLVMDGENVRFDAAGAAAQALADAKADAAEKYQVKGEYDVAGAAAQALTDAKSYADDLNTAMDERVDALETDVENLKKIDHEKLASDASAAAVATVLDGAPEKFDTLKEIAAWIAEADTAEDAASLVSRVSALEAIDHDAYIVYTDEAVKGLKENEIKANADAIAVLNGTEEGSVAKAVADTLTAANAYADGLADNYDAAGSAAQALTDAKTYVDEKGYATVTQVNAKQDIIEDLQTIREGAAAGATALQAVPEEYVTETELTAKGYLTADDFTFATDGEIDSLFV